MKRLFALFLATAAITFGSASIVQASPLSLEYSVSNLGGGTFDYQFHLALDNHDNSWSAGQGWSWLTFGDALNNTPSPLANFSGNPASLPIGPWNTYSTSFGGHNGPTLLYNNANIAYWVPAQVGDFLNWSGTSTADLAQGSLHFSTLLVTGNANMANFEVATRVNPVPEPSTMLLIGSGIAGLAFMRRKLGVKL